MIEFLKELKALCAKHSAEISVSKDGELMVAFYGDYREDERAATHYIVNGYISEDLEDVEEYRRVKV